MLMEAARKNYLENGKNCAEAILLAANKQYQLGLDESATRLIAGFGSGMGCHDLCGALAGGIAVLGQLFGTSEDLKETCADFVAAFEEKLGSTNCEVLMKKYRTPADRCAMTIALTGELLEQFIAKKKGLSTQPAGTVTVSPLEIKRVKGLGFLHAKGTDNFNGRVITRNGKLTNEEMQTLTEAANLYGNGEIAMTTRLTVECQGIPFENIDAFRAHLAKAGLETGGTGSKVRPVVSCKGTTCQYGLCDTFALSNEIHDRLYTGYHEVSLPHKFKFAVGGCPNNCVKPNLNDVGIVGQRIPSFQKDLCRGCKKCAVEEACPIKISSVVDGKLVIGEDCNHCGRCVGKCPFHAMDESTYGYKLYIGGRWGKQVAIGRPLTHIFTSKEAVLAACEKCVLLFREQGISGERFADTVARIGFEQVEAQLLSDDLLERKSEILGLDVAAGATC